MQKFKTHILEKIKRQNWNFELFDGNLQLSVGFL